MISNCKSMILKLAKSIILLIISGENDAKNIIAGFELSNIENRRIKICIQYLLLKVPKRLSLINLKKTLGKSKLSFWLSKVEGMKKWKNLLE
jgi:hypothetical protein